MEDGSSLRRRLDSLRSIGTVAWPLARGKIPSGPVRELDARMNREKESE